MGGHFRGVHLDMIFMGGIMSNGDFSIFNICIPKDGLKAAILFAALMAGPVLAQPAGVPAGANAACPAGPGAASDTVVAGPDTAGFRPIFNGEDFKGWWESCQSPHTTNADRTNGGIWLVDREQKAIFSNQTTGGSGSILMTNKSYTNYELMLDLWLDFGNDAGIFHRTNATGRCYQTVLDYISQGSVGGVWGENGYHTSTVDIRPFRMGSSESQITDRGSWAFTGNWADAWDINGWNQIRMEVFGNPPRVRTYIRKVGAPAWIPVLDHTSPVSNQASGYIGIQIHQGTDRWSGRAGNWYRNIMVRPLTTAGVPIPQGPPTMVNPKRSELSGAGLKIVAGIVTGMAESEYILTYRDLHGRVLDSHQGSAGTFSHPFPAQATGMVLAEMRFNGDVKTQKLAVPVQF